MNIDQIAELSLQELQDAFVGSEVSPVEIMQVSLDQNEAVNGQINALYDVRVEAAIKEARQAEKRYSKKTNIGPFDGVPVTIKDSVNAVGMQWFHGSAIHGEGLVATKDSPPAARLKQAGAIIIGKGVMPDFGLSASGVSGSHGIVRNPWGHNWSTGGSSAGCGALHRGVG